MKKKEKPTKYWSDKKRSDETKNKISNTLKNKYKTGELKALHTERSRRLISQSVKRHHSDKRASELISRNTIIGMKKSNASNKISIARKGKLTMAR